MFIVIAVNQQENIMFGIQSENAENCVIFRNISIKMV